MPVDEVDQVVDPVIRAYRRAHLSVTEQLRDVINDPRQWRRASRLRDTARSIGHELATLERSAAQGARAIAWTNELGFATGSVMAGAQTIDWNLIDTRAVERLSRGLYTDLLEATRNVDATSKRFLRRLGRDTQLQKALEGRTAVQAGQSMTRIAGHEGIYAVRYANGALHGMGEYAEMAMRTVSGQVYNTSMVQGAIEEGCEWFEIFDGPGCGLEFHEDGHVADGMVVDARTAAHFPLSHPNCRRSFGARPDVRSAAEAEGAERNTTLAEREDQIRADIANQLPMTDRGMEAARSQVRGRSPSVSDPRGYRAVRG